MKQQNRQKVLALIVCGTLSLINGLKNYTVPIGWEQMTDKPYISGPISVGGKRLEAMYLMNFEDIVVVSSECSNCPFPTYNPKESATMRELDDAWNQQINIPYTADQHIGLQCRGIKDKVCLGLENICSEGNEKGYPFLIVTQQNGNKLFLEEADAMVGLSPNPDSKIESFGEYLVRSEMIEKHIVTIDQEQLTFGDYNETKDPKFVDFEFDKTLQNWGFKTNQVKIAGHSFIDNTTLVSIQNYVPGTYIWTTNPQLPAAFASAMMKSGENITCTIKDKVADCMFANSTCAPHEQAFANMTFETTSGTVFHITPKSFLKEVGKDCIIQITVNASQSFLATDPKDVIYIGEDLFVNYYVVLDYDQKRIGLGGHTTTVDNSSAFPLWAIIAIVAGGLLIIAGVAIGFIVRRRKVAALSRGLSNYDQLDN